MARTIVGILRGGNSSEYDLSLKTGASILSALPEEKYDARDIFIDRSGMWHARGIPVTPTRALTQIDVVLNALHGGMGEDGTVGRILELAHVPYAGARPFASAASLNKLRARQLLQHAGIKVPRAVSFSMGNAATTAEMAQAVFSQFGPPYVVKPVSDGASHGIKVTLSIIELPDAIADILDQFGSVLVEEFVRGREATVGVIEDYRNEELYALPPAEIELPEGQRHIDFDMRRKGVMHRVPSSFSHDEKGLLADIARAAHRALDLSHYSRTDIILTKRGSYVLEVNALPALHEGAAFPAMLESVGSTSAEFCEHLIRLAQRP